MASFVDSIADAQLRVLYDYWSGHRGERPLPSRADIDPIELRGLLPNLILVEVEEGGPRFRLRLVGTEVVQQWGRDFTGRCIDEFMSGAYHDFIHGLYSEVVAQGVALYSESMFRWDQGRAINTRRLLLPLAGDGQRVDMILQGQTFERSSSLIASPVSLKDAGFEVLEISRSVAKA